MNRCPKVFMCPQVFLLFRGVAVPTGGLNGSFGSVASRIHRQARACYGHAVLVATWVVPFGKFTSSGAAGGTNRGQGKLRGKGKGARGGTVGPQKIATSKGKPTTSTLEVTYHDHPQSTLIGSHVIFLTTCMKELKGIFQIYQS